VLESEGEVEVDAGPGSVAPPTNSVLVTSFGVGLSTEVGILMEDVREGTGELKDPVIWSILNEVEYPR